jgi:hypothetical protein
MAAFYMAVVFIALFVVIVLVIGVVEVSLLITGLVVVLIAREITIGIRRFAQTRFAISGSGRVARLIVGEALRTVVVRSPRVTGASEATGRVVGCFVGVGNAVPTHS